MLEWAREITEFSARALEIVGVCTIVFGALAGSVMFVRNLHRAVPIESSYRQYRRDLGRAILLGLEYLVGADIIATVAIAPSYRSAGVLALIVLIRTFLSISLEVEIEGRWPWQRGEQ